MLNLLALDYGASSGRAILGKFDGERLTLEEVHRFSNDPVLVNDTLYWDTLRLFYEMKQGILKCSRKGVSDLAGIGTDTWGVDFGLLNDSGELLGNPVHYRDKRNDGMMEKAFGIVPKKEIYDKTGIQFLKLNTIYQLLSMKLNNSQFLDRASTLLFTPDLLNYFLTGEKVTEYTIASTSQMLNAKKRDWDYSLIEKIGIPGNILTSIVDSGTIIGKISESIADELNIKSVPVIAIAGHDTASAVVAVPFSRSGSAFLSSGTWSLLGVETKEPIINDITFKYEYTNEGGFGKTIRLLKNIMGLWIYQECKRTWDKKGEDLSYQDIEQMASKAPHFTCFINPDDDIFLSPGNMPSKIQEYCKNTGQTVPEGKGAIVRCIFESLALKYRQSFEAIESIAGKSIPMLHVVGGGSQNKMLNQFTANAIGRIVSTGPIEATAAGNILCQLIALNQVKDLAEAREIVRKSFGTEEYMPRQITLWDEAYARYKALFNKAEE